MVCCANENQNMYIYKRYLCSYKLKCKHQNKYAQSNFISNVTVLKN